MADKLPENLGALELDELDTLLTERLDAAAALNEVADEDITDEQIEQLEALGAEITAIQGEQGVREQAAADRQARVAAARAKTAAAADEAPADAAENVDEPADAEVPDDASELVDEEEKEAVVASARKPVVKRATSRIPAPEVPAAEPEKTPTMSLVAAADVRGFNAGQELTSMEEVAAAFYAKASTFREGHGKQSFRNQYPVFEIRKNLPAELTIGKQSSDEDAFKVLTAAADLYKQDPTNALVASGGWAAPSEIRYDLPILETVDGLFNLPSVQVNRGGFQYTKGIDWSVIYGDANVFFNQTETQAAAQTAKPFLGITDPTFTEVRLEAIGAGIRAGILTNHAWPELIQRFVSGSATAFAHKKNNYIINKVVATLTAVTADTYGDTFTDTLGAIELQVQQMRYKYRLSQNQVFDGIAPVWLKSVFREDLSRRQGTDVLAITDAQIISWLSARGVRLQFVYDWQDLPGTTVDYPATAVIGLWLPGTYVLGGGPVISFDALYDYNGISQNTYTVAFVEESILVAQMLSTTGRAITVNTAAAKRIGAVGPRSITHI